MLLMKNLSMAGEAMIPCWMVNHQGFGPMVPGKTMGARGAGQARGGGEQHFEGA